jgi:hypothetical protein
MVSWRIAAAMFNDTTTPSSTSESMTTSVVALFGTPPGDQWLATFHNPSPERIQTDWACSDELLISDHAISWPISTSDAEPNEVRRGDSNRFACWLDMVVLPEVSDRTDEPQPTRYTRHFLRVGFGGEHTAGSIRAVSDWKSASSTCMRDSYPGLARA